jgi:hypothetical protein
VGAATLSVRLCAAGLAAALVLAQLICGIHKAEAVTHKPGEVCDLCLALANVDYPLVDIAALPSVPAKAAVQYRPSGQPPLTAPIHEFRARAPPPSRLIPLAW